MYAERTTIQYVDLTNNSRSTQIKGLRGAVAVAYNMKDKYIYWADIKDHIIYGRGIEDDGKNFNIFVKYENTFLDLVKILPWYNEVKVSRN